MMHMMELESSRVMNLDGMGRREYKDKWQTIKNKTLFKVKYDEENQVSHLWWETSNKEGKKRNSI